MSVIISIFAVLLSLCQVLNPAFMKLVHGEDYYFEDWSANTAFSEDYAHTLTKEADKDFKILSLTDIQLNILQVYSSKGANTRKMIDELITKTSPDLIILPGDNASSTAAYLSLIKHIDSYAIPWAPIMGNHDGQNCMSEFWCAYMLANAEHCLFKFGPKDMGYGNYIVNIKENDKLIHSLFFMDTHSYLDKDGKPVISDGNEYDHLWQNQLEWYKWAVNGISSLAGKTVDSTVVIHIPLVEYNTAWEQAYDADNNCYKAEYADTSFGVNNESVCSPKSNNGFFELCKDLGSTKNIICGHDHVNCASIVYDGIRLTYSLKSGSGAYHDKAMTGGTLQTIHSDGSFDIEHIYLEVPDSGC